MFETSESCDFVFTGADRRFGTLLEGPKTPVSTRDVFWCKKPNPASKRFPRQCCPVWMMGERFFKKLLPIIQSAYHNPGFVKCTKLRKIAILCSPVLTRDLGPCWRAPKLRSAPVMCFGAKSRIPLQSGSPGNAVRFG